MARMSNAKKKNITSLFVLAFTLIVFFILRSLIANGTVDQYTSRIILVVCVNVIAAVSLNMVTGMLGQLVLGHAGFMLAGAYATAILTDVLAPTFGLELSLLVGLVAGGVFSALLGLVIGLPALRLRGDYLAIVTLGFGEIIRVVANNLPITNGAKGLQGFAKFPSSSPERLFTFVFLIAAFVIFFSYTFGTSRHGRSVIAIREDEIAAEASGINTVYYKLLAFTLSAFFAGVAGGLYAMQNGLVAPKDFDFNRSIEILMMVVLGGMGSITGSVLSASVLTILPELLRTFATYRMLVYSIILIFVMLFRPQGLLGRAEIKVMKPFAVIRDRLRKGKTPKGGGAA